MVQKTEPGETAEAEEEEQEEESDVWTDRELFTLETPEDRSFYRKKVFISGKTLDSELSSFSWKTAEGETEEIETDYAGEFGFYIPTETLDKSLKIYMTALKDDGSRHDKLIVLFNRNVKPEIIIEKPSDSYRFGKYLTVKGHVDIPGHDKYISSLVKEARIFLSPAGLDEELHVSGNGSFRYVLDTSLYNIADKQKLLVNVSLNNYKSSSHSVEIMKSDYDIVDYDISAGDGSISLSWDDLPVEAEYRICISSGNSEETVLDNIISPVRLNSLANSTVYKIRIEAEEAGSRDVLMGKNELVLPLDPSALKPSAEGYFGRIKVKWPHINEASKYNLFRNSVRSGEKVLLAEGFSGESFTDENVTPAESYRYSVEPDGFISVRSLETLSKPSNGGEKKIHEIKEVDESYDIGKIFVINNYAYTMSDRIIINDITDINNPVYSGEINEAADYISVDEEYCYIVSSENGFVLYNISDPSNPVPVVRREQYKGNCIFSRFPYVYINEEERGIRVLNIEQPDMPAKEDLYTGYSFTGVPVAGDENELLMTSFSDDGKVIIFRIDSEGKLSRKHERTTEYDIAEAQSSFVNDRLVSAAMTGDGRIILFNPFSDDSEIHMLQGKGKTLGLNIFTAHSGRSYLAVDRVSATDLYYLYEDAEPVYFTSVEKNEGGYISVCSDNNGYLYLVKSQDGLELYRIMTEGVSYISNRYIFPGRIEEFELSGDKLIALTENGIYYSDRNDYLPAPVALSEGIYRQIWSSPSYTAAIDENYNYKILPYESGRAVKADNNGYRGRKAVSAGDYSVILNDSSELLFFSFDITGNAPRLIASMEINGIKDILSFSDSSINYICLVMDNSVEIFRITEKDGFEKISEIKEEKIDKAECVDTEVNVEINIYSGSRIGKYLLEEGKVKSPEVVYNVENDVKLYKDFFVRSEGEEGISIYKIINGKMTLVSRCPGVFSFETSFSEGKLYSKGFDSVDEIEPVIPAWFR